MLDYLQSHFPNDDLPLKRLSCKLVTLLALDNKQQTTGQRIQTLSKIKVQNIIISPEGIKILIPEEIKSTSARLEQPCLHLPFFRSKALFLLSVWPQHY